MPLPLLALLGIGAAGAFGGRALENRREDKSAEAALQAGRQARSTGAPDIISGAGFPVGPRVGADPAQQQQLGAISRGLSSDDQFTRTASLQNIQNLQTSTGMLMTPTQKIQQEQAQQTLNTNREMDPLRVQSAAQALEASKQQFAFNQQAQPMQLAGMAADLSASTQDFQQGLLDIQLKEQQLAAAAIPTLPDVVPMLNPLTGMLDNVSVAGKDYRAQQTSVDAYLRNLDNINSMQGLISEFGSEMGGQGGVRMSQVRSAILMNSVQARGGGAPQEAELELLGEGLPDPTSFSANLRGAAQAMLPGVADVLRSEQEKKFIAGYSDFGLEVSKGIYDMLRQNPALRVDVDKLDPRIWIDEAERDFYRANSGENLIIR